MCVGGDYGAAKDLESVGSSGVPGSLFSYVERMA